MDTAQERVLQWLRETYRFSQNDPVKKQLSKALQKEVNLSSKAKNMKVDGVFTGMMSKLCPAIEHGATGNFVYILQCGLIVNGRNLPLTGIFDDRTKGSVENWQAAHGYFVNGVADYKVFAGLLGQEVK